MNYSRHTGARIAGRAARRGHTQRGTGRRTGSTFDVDVQPVEARPTHRQRLTHDHYDRNRDEGKRHSQALIALARRRVWAEGRDNLVERGRIKGVRGYAR
ncbi:hypothetical protein [Georgenia ruanii]|uniref:hypothetical protein n=1 Tax=Georgenia ruanii TaxID=348442 RepID=UPI00186B0408|nr:hypothetical protein [Georgenia ruanii]